MKDNKSSVLVYELVLDENTLPVNGQNVIVYSEDGKSYTAKYNKPCRCFEISKGKSIAAQEVISWRKVL